MTDRAIHIFMQAGLKNLCGARSSVFTGKMSVATFSAETQVVDAYPRALEAPEGWKIVFEYGEAMYPAVPVEDEDRFCHVCRLLHTIMKANGFTSRRAARRLLRASGGMK